MPKVSILTITYNRADLIHRCIESVQSQTFQDYEHIIADGGSSDNTEEVVLSYNDPHIKYIKLQNKGPEFQMREAFKLSTGQYITFLDDDDEYLPDKLAILPIPFSSLSAIARVIACLIHHVA